MPITLQENLRGILYTPFYAALSLGAYRHEGVEAGFVTAPEPARAVEGLFAGTVDVAWGGPMRVMQTYDRRPDCDLVCFGEAVTRDPFFLIGREPRPDFAFADLYGKRVATVSEVPTPWLCLQEDLRRAGLDPDALPRIADRTMADNAAGLRRGEVDVVQLFQPFAEELIAAAHAGCFTMALSAALSQSGFAPKRLATQASVSLEQLSGQWTISSVHLEVEAWVPGISAEQFQKIAADAKAGCPVSRLLRAEVSMHAKLEPL